jgi:ATP-dependent DNA helicase RecG
VFIDRVEIWNSGNLPSGLSISDLKKPHKSYPNNPLIADVLYLADYIQEAGSGIIEMIKQCKENGLPDPEFVVDKNNFRVIISRDVFTENVLVRLGINERQMKAVKYVKEKGKITNKEYRELTGISKPTATRELSFLVKNKIFEQKGIVGKGTCYILKRSNGS